MQCVHAKTVYTGRSVVEDAYVAFSGQTIAGVSRRPRGEVIGRFDTVTPAFIDPHSHIGMHRAGEPSGEGEANDHSDGILALPDALDSVQMDDVSLAEAVEMGALYSCVVPGSGNIIGGLSAVIRNYGPDTTGALIARAGVKGAFGYNPMSTKSWQGTRATTRMGSIALLRKALMETRDKVSRHRKARGPKKDEIVLTPTEQVLRELLGGRQRLRAHVHKVDDVAALLRLVDEFKLRVTVEHAMDIHQPGIYAELRKRRIPVAYGPVDAFAYKVELKHANWRNIRHLVESGVQYGLMTDHPVTPARQLFLSARWFTRAGLSKQQAVELVSRRNAELLGIDDVLGTLAKGKWASMACWNGDPFDVTCYPTAVFGEGELLYAE
jgi:imidazolonepropionase-like amidohydrolase